MATMQGELADSLSESARLSHGQVSGVIQRVGGTSIH